MPSVAEIERTVRKVNSVLEIGPGIRPNWEFARQVYVAIEPHEEYVKELLKQRLFVLQGKARDVLPLIQSVDSIFLIDVIEHMEKEEGKEVLDLCKRIAKEQVIVFTPLGFQEQAYAPGQKDAWGMNGQYWQTHRSGWQPEDFVGWSIGITPNFHGVGKGAIYAVYEVPRV